MSFYDLSNDPMTMPDYRGVCHSGYGSPKDRDGDEIVIFNGADDGRENNEQLPQSPIPV